jgi:uncharacterized protein (DUF1684 family)
MKSCFKIIIFLFLVPFIQEVAAQTDIYQKEIATWHKQRIEELKAPNGWLNLAGLFWLKPGKNSFGSATTNDIVFKHPDMPALAGYFELADGKVTWQTAAGVVVLQKDSAITKALIYQQGNFRPPLLALKNFRWSIIQRDDKIGIRFRDLKSPALEKFKGIDRYPVDSNWRIPAYLEAPTNSIVAITNVLGQISNQPTPGKLVFTIGKTVYKLDALEESPGELFIIFGDATSGKETYPAGRFVYVKKPAPGEATFIDFNKAYNPPCAFSDFATCPLPPKQNVLPVAIVAGEKNY